MPDAFAWTGVASLFRSAGFAEAAGEHPLVVMDVAVIEVHEIRFDLAEFPQERYLLANDVQIGRASCRERV